jgi:hypothetical protein
MRSKRWMFQFTFRSLLLMVLACACFFAWIRYRSESWHRATANLDGKWEVVDSNLGEPPVSLEFHRGMITWRMQATGDATLNCSMPVFADANEIDIVRADGIRLPAIYSLDGDRLTLIHGQPHSGRPDSVESIGWPHIRINLRRIKSSNKGTELPRELHHDEPS